MLGVVGVVEDTCLEHDREAPAHCAAPTSLLQSEFHEYTRLVIGHVRSERNARLQVSRPCVEVIEQLYDMRYHH